MQFNLEINRDRYAIRAYGPGTVTITLPLSAEVFAPDALDAIGPASSRMRQEILSSSFIITPTQLIRDWPPQTFAELHAAHLETLAELVPEVVLLGTGARLQWPGASLVASLAAAGIGYEVMDTAAACRTYNILMGDGRRVAAALMMI